MRIGLVEDDKKCLAQLQEIIKKSNPGDEIVTFNHPIEALEYIKYKGIDEVFIEIKLKGMTGLALTREIKAINKQIKIILMSTSEEYAIEAWKVHADYFLIKPITLEAIFKMRA